MAFQSFWKETREERERRERQEERQYAKARKICRYVTFRRAKGCCEHCGRPLILEPKEARHEFDIANIHEEPPRSQGGDPLNPDCTVCLCCHCHERVTRNKLFVVFETPGASPRGKIRFENAA